MYKRSANPLERLADSLNIPVRAIYIGLFVLFLIMANNMAKSGDIFGGLKKINPFDIITQIGIVAVLVYSVVLHEVAHGYTAYRLGDPTPKFKERLSLNPFDHIRPIVLVLLLILVLFGIQSVFLGILVAFTFARPVPVDFRNLRDRKSQGIVALAGPLTNITIGTVFSLLLVIMIKTGMHQNIAGSVLIAVFNVGMRLNFALAFFNLIPVLPLDGGRILASQLSDRYYYNFMQMERYGIIIIIVFIVAGITQYIFLFAGVISNLLIRLWGMFL